MSPVLTFILSLAACGSDGTASPVVPATSEAPVVTPAAAAAAAVAAPDHESGPHAHSSAHGGIVQAVDGLHIEALMMPGGVMFYLADQAQKPLPVDGYAGNAVIRGPSGIVTVELMPMGDHLHAAAALLQGQPATAVLTLTHDGKAVSATFETATVGLQSHDHTSLHGGAVSMWGDFHLEYAPADGDYRVWVTDAHRNPVPGPLSGWVQDGAVKIPMVEGEGGLLSATGQGAGTRPVTVEVTAGGKTFALGFNAVR